MTVTMAIADLYKLWGLLPVPAKDDNSKRGYYILLLAMAALFATGSGYISNLNKGVAYLPQHAPHRQPPDKTKTPSEKIYSVAYAPIPKPGSSIYTQTKAVGNPSDEPFDYNHMGCELLRAIISTVTGVIFEDYMGNEANRLRNTNHVPAAAGATVPAASYGPWQDGERKQSTVG